MTLLTVAMVLSAALLHALWNAVVKGATDKTIMLGMIALGHFIPGVLIVCVVPLPSWESVPYILASSVIHWGYYFLLNIAYRYGDLSLSYPIARGLSPVLIALGAQFWVGEVLPPMVWLGILGVSGGIMFLAGGVIRQGASALGLVSACGVGICISGYSLVDGVGARVSGHALSYIAWHSVAEILVVVFVFATRMDRVRQTSIKALSMGFFGGVISLAAYGIVLYAATFSPLGIVSALRETSVIFAALIGVFWFREGPMFNRMMAGGIVATGIVVIGLAN